RLTLAPRQRDFIPGDGHARRTPRRGRGQVVADAEEIFAVLLRRDAGGDLDLRGLLRRDVRQIQFSFADDLAVFQQFPRGVDWLHAAEKPLVVDAQLDLRRGDVHRAGV